MRPPVPSRSRQGLLLVEAILSAVVIAVGLVFITRALGSQLTAMHRVESYETLAALARSRLAQLEAEQLSAPPEQPLRGDRAGTIGDAYAWDVTAIHREDVSEIRLKVWSPQEQAAQRLTLKAIWPSWWVPENWYTAQ